MTIEQYRKNLEQYDWFTRLEDKRVQDEIVHAAVYAHEFSHGTIGHDALLIIHKLTEKLCEMEDLGKTEKAE